MYTNVSSKTSSKKRKACFRILVCVVTVLIMCLSGCSSSGASNIVGTWNYMDSAISFNSSGSFEGTYKGRVNRYGTYTFYDDNKLSMTYKQDGPLGTYTESFEWNSLAEQNSKYWYISGNKLYLNGYEYTKK